MVNPTAPVQSREYLENEKLRLDIQKLRDDLSFSGRVWSRLVTVLPLILSAAVVYVSCNSQKAQQSYFQHAQGVADKSHRDDMSRSALTLATDDSGESDRKIAGIWQLDSFESDPTTFRVAAGTLTAQLGLPPKYDAARCAALYVLGDALARVKKGHEKDRETLAVLLFGKSGKEEGLIIRQNQLSRDLPNAGEDLEGSPCRSGLEATREVIRMNSAYLQERNFRLVDLRGIQLQKTDLSRTDLSGANLAGATLQGSNLTGVNLRCANLNDADLDDIQGLDSADLLYANWKDSPNQKIRALDNAHEIFHLDDKQWDQWRQNGMRIKNDEPQLDGKDGDDQACLTTNIPK